MCQIFMGTNNRSRDLDGVGIFNFIVGRYYGNYRHGVSLMASFLARRFQRDTCEQTTRREDDG
jgi:hypothetical protein